MDLQDLAGLFFIMPYIRCILSYCSESSWFLSLDNGITNQDLGAKYDHDFYGDVASRFS